MNRIRIVVDSSVMVKWFIPETYSEEALKLLEDHLHSYTEIVIPSFAFLEFCNAMRKYFIRGIVSKQRAAEAYSLLNEIELHSISITRDMVKKALEYALETHVTLYDAYYIVLAKNLKTVFYTADEKLLSRLSSFEPLVRHVADYVKDRDKLLHR